MRNRIKTFVRRLLVAFRQHPIEVGLAVLLGCLGCVCYETESRRLVTVVSYSPVFFLVTYMLNTLTAGTRGRGIYYLSLFLFVPVLFLSAEVSIWTAHYGVTLLVVQLLYLISDRQRENVAFVRKALRYLFAWLSAGFLAGVAWLLVNSIYHSVQYIFEIWQQGEERFVTYSLSIVFLTVMPLLFLLFNQEKEAETGKTFDRLFDTLLNYVLSPALLAYAVILYLYLLKIIVLWSLPKGGVAYIVTFFVSALFLLKGCQPFLKKRYYDWLYRHASGVAFPTMLLYWVGACYRIHQYGYTEARVYLVVAGVILTGMVLLFFTRRTGRYWYVACLAIVSLATVTYIPGITAKEIERISQTKRGNYPPQETKETAQNYYISNKHFSLDITDYATLQPVTSDGEGAINSVLEKDTFYLQTQDSLILFKMQKDTLLNRQLENAGLCAADSIPESAYPALLRLDLDSALYLFGNMYLHRVRQDSTYEITYMGDGYYLRKNRALPRSE